MEKDLIEQLREVIEEKGLSPEIASRFMEVGFKSVYRWLKGESKPSFTYRKMIRLGIKRMQRLPSIGKSSFEQDRDLYRLIKKKMTFEEKLWLMDTKGDYQIYRQRLRDLAAKYEIELK